MIRDILTIFVFSLFLTACSVNQLSKEKEFIKKELEREKVSQELLNDISYILFLLSNMLVPCLSSDQDWVIVCYQ